MKKLAAALVASSFALGSLSTFAAPYADGTPVRSHVVASKVTTVKVHNVKHRKKHMRHHVRRHHRHF